MLDSSTREVTAINNPLRLFERIKAGGKGGAPGQWSARKAQMLASAYKKAGGGYTSYWLQNLMRIQKLHYHFVIL